LDDPPVHKIRDIMIAHLENLYAFYGEYSGVRIARKHISWYSKGQRDGAAFRHAMNHVESTNAQLAMARSFFDQLENKIGQAA